MKNLKKCIVLNLLLAICIVLPGCKGEDEIVYDLSNVLFKDVPIDVVKKCVIGSWNPFRQFGGVAGITEIEDITVEYSEFEIIICYEADQTQKKIKVLKWEKQHDLCVLIGEDGLVITYLSSIKENILVESNGLLDSSSMVTLSKRNK